MKFVDGDLVALAEAGQFDVIAHGCNCMRTMGAGIAVAIKRTFPEAWEADRATAQGDRAKLGTCTVGVCQTGDHELHVVNAYTQYDYQGGGVLADYAAIASCMAWIKRTYAGQRIGLPLIGAGLAKGDWATIEHIIATELSGEDVTIVRYSPANA